MVGVSIVVVYILVVLLMSFNSIFALLETNWIRMMETQKNPDWVGVGHSAPFI